MRPRRVSMLALILLAFVSALPGLPGRAWAEDPGCPRPAGVPEGARYSCPTHTQTWQPGETVTRHPGGAPGRGTGQSTGSTTSTGQTGSTGQPSGNSVWCQIEQDGQCHCGPRQQGTGRNIPCRPGSQTQSANSAVRHVFNYYYLNGINTPMTGQGRGNYRWDWQMIKANLLDQATPVGQVPQRGAGYNTRIHVADEIDLLTAETHNPSGRDPKVTLAAADFCKAARSTLGNGLSAVSNALCGVTSSGATWLDDVRSGKAIKTMSLGDLYECVLQVQGFDIGWNNVHSGIAGTAKMPEVQDVANRIVDIYDREQRLAQGGGTREVNYFIVIGHSQGNFFAEGVAYALKQQGGSGAAVFAKRLGILSLASPTSYDSLPDSFTQSRLKHVTRMDDAILALESAAAPLHAKLPLPGNAAPLWPWPAGNLGDMVHAITQLAAPPACACPDPDDALYIPQMNSHLIDNYLTDPPLTEPGRTINAEAAQKMARRASMSARGMSPQTTPVLGQVRQSLFELKSELLTGQ